MKLMIHIKIYKDKPMWETAAIDEVIVNLSNKNDPETVAHEAEKLFLKLLKEIKNEKNQTEKEDD